MLEFRRLFLDGNGGAEAEDDPPPFEGRPSPGGAQDSAGFLERYPAAGNIGGVAFISRKTKVPSLDDTRDDFLTNSPAQPASASADEQTPLENCGGNSTRRTLA